jgi:F-type H+-transporting ATPase subunit a
MLTGSVITVVSVLSSVMLTFLELLVAFIQAYIFAFLTTVFLSLALHPEH